MLCCSVCQAHKGAPLTGVLLWCSVRKALKGLPWLGSFSVVWASGVWWVSLSVVQLLVQECGERGFRDGATPTHDSGVSACLHGCLIFLQRHFPPQSPSSCPLGPTPHSQQQTSPWDCSTIPTLQLPVAMPSGKHASLSGVPMAVTRIVCVILIPFGLSQISCFTLSLNCFSSGCGDRTPASVPPLAECRSSPTNSPFFPLLLSSY